MDLGGMSALEEEAENVCGLTPEPQSHVLSSDMQKGEVVQGAQGHYQVVDSVPIGSGTSGTVYAGIRVGDRAEVAIKVIDR